MTWSVLWDYRWELLAGLRATVFLSASTIVLSTFAGTVVGIARASRNRLLRKVATGYTEVLRNIPLVVKLFFLYFGFNLDPLSACVVGLTLHQSAYISDVIRSGVLAVGVGQSEAGATLGLSTWQTERLIVLPQALRIVAPALTNQFIEAIKNSSVAMTITIAELTFVTQTIQQETYRGFEAATAVTALYAGLAALVVIGMHIVEASARYEIRG